MHIDSCKVKGRNAVSIFHHLKGQFPERAQGKKLIKKLDNTNVGLSSRGLSILIPSFMLGVVTASDYTGISASEIR